MFTATHDFIGGSDLPGELLDDADWNERTPVDCALCYAPADDTGTGLCRICLQQVPPVGGCGKGLALAVPLSDGDGDGAQPLAHLITCGQCRAWFDRLAEFARV